MTQQIDELQNKSAKKKQLLNKKYQPKKFVEISFGITIVVCS